MLSNFTPVSALAGGAILGLASGALLVGAGKIAGVTGQLESALRLTPGERTGALFVLGLIVGGLVVHLVAPELVPGITGPPVRLAIAGLLVGFGARLGNGCTSGHGICGNSRLSPRSVLATVTFMGAAFITVATLRGLLV